MDIDSETLGVLRQMTWTTEGGATLGVLPPGQLDRKLYVAVNKVLEEAGGKWSRKCRAHVFQKDPRPTLGVAITTGTIRTAREDGYFPTPPAIAERLVQKLSLGWGRKPWRVLEPSAGTGALVLAIITHFGPDHVRVVAVERDPGRFEELKELHAMANGLGSPDVLFATRGDFLKDIELVEPVDGVVMNPPFDRSGIHLKHFWKAWSMLRPGGRIAAILPPSVSFRQDEAHVHFREQILEHPDTTVEHLPTGTFADAGTQIATIMVSATKSTQVAPPVTKRDQAKAKKAKANASDVEASGG
jgi:hypothetical protein